MDGSAVARRVRAGRLHIVHRGVYLVGHDGLSPERRWMAAVLACGDGAVLSHSSAAALWGLLRPLEGPVAVSVPTRNGRKPRDGIRLHRCPSLVEPDVAPSYRYARSRRHVPLVTERNHIPVTSVPRTLDDLHGSVAPALARRAWRQAELMGYRFAGSDRTRSDLERAFLRLCRRYGLPLPLVNVRVGRWLVDFLWPEQRLVVEADFWGYHRGSVAFEDDHARDLGLRALGYRVRRFTDRQIDGEPDRIAADLVAALEESIREKR